MVVPSLSCFQLFFRADGDIDFKRSVFSSLKVHPENMATMNCSLHWRHNDHDGVSNHQPHGCLLNRLFRRRSKKTSKLCVTGLCVGNSLGPVNSPHKGPVTRKMFPFDDVIMSGVSWDLLQAVFMFLRITHSDYRNNTTEVVSYHG